MNIRIALFVSVALAGSVQAQTQPAASRVSSLLRRAIILDLHDDTTQMILDEGYDFAGRHQYGQVDLPRMRDGHVTGLFFSSGPIPCGIRPPNPSAEPSSRSTPSGASRLLTLAISCWPLPPIKC